MMRNQKNRLFPAYILYPGIGILYLFLLAFLFVGIKHNILNVPILLLCFGTSVFALLLFIQLKKVQRKYNNQQKSMEDYIEEIESLQKERRAKEVIFQEATQNLVNPSTLKQIQERILEDYFLLTKLLAGVMRDLSHTNTMTEEKVVKIINSLSEIRNQSKSLLSIMEKQEKNAGDLAEKQLSRLEQNTKTLRILSAYQEKRLSQIEDDSKRINEALSEVKNLTTLTKLIREITEQTNLLALNAAVVAARAGAAGKTFSVIAREIRKLSQQIENTTRKIETQISSIVSNIEEKLSAVVDTSRTNEEKHQIELIMYTLTSMNQAFTEVSGYFADLFTESHKVMKQIHQDIIEALGDTQFQDVLRQRIEHVMEGLNLMAEYFSDITSILKNGKQMGLGDHTWPSLRELIEKLNSNHPVVSSTSPYEESASQKLPNIELF